uniref:NADH-ubiquinone oxidoreductase chain 1 n=1 Tax=Prosevania sp. ZJUH_2016031 TaxID=2491170 RepID=A0A3Q8UAG0_9HYME|nr:NADH dehydrogenase subunit 1 [Prosevania sp. ZJUH_2016031]
MEIFSFGLILNYLILILLILLSISFLTLLERKVLGILQDRKGPNKVVLGGLIQPIGDGIKLFVKEFIWIYKSNFYIYILGPMLSMIIMLMCWIFYDFIYEFFMTSFSLFLLISLLSLSVYSFMLSGWTSSSMYSLFGSLRSISQTVSYEVSLIFLLMFQFFFVKTFNFYDVVMFQQSFNFLMILFFVFWLIFILILAELNRTPFDLVEGESELVSGFNVEYLSSLFALIFLGEYGMMLFFFNFLIIFFIGHFFSILFFLLFMFMYLGIRGVLPRVRYDKLMYLIWKGILPVSMNVLLIMFNFIIFIDIILF